MLVPRRRAGERGDALFPAQSVMTTEREAGLMQRIPWSPLRLLVEGLLLGTLALTLLSRSGPAQAPARAGPAETPGATPSTAALVTVFLQVGVVPRLARVEAAAARVDRAVSAAHDVVEGYGLLASLFSQQAALLSGSSRELTAPALPPLGPVLTPQLCALLEDLALAGDELARLYTETAAAVSSRPFVEGLTSVAYWPRAQSVEALLRRAEGWVKTLEEETGAQVALPGVLGERALQKQLGWPQ
jgi:hypothetical protein